MPHELNEKQKTPMLHKNISFLLKRADNAMLFQDYPLVLLSCASIFEAIAKLQTKRKNISYCSLMSFWDSFVEQTTLPVFIIAFFKKVYKMRNNEALAAHGNLYESTFKKKDATILLTLTKTIISLI